MPLQIQTLLPCKAKKLLTKVKMTLMTTKKRKKKMKI